MKKSKIILGFVLLLTAAGIFITSCSKDSSSPASTSLTSAQTIQVQNSDAQDAVAEQTEQDVDNKLDELQNSNYAASNLKSGLAELNDTVIITVDHPDTTTFPKVITLTYYNYVDSTANETLIKNGTISIYVSLANPDKRRLVTRAYTFTNFSVTTDSTTVILNGTRTVARTKDAFKANGWQSARVAVTDNITAALKYSIVTTGSTDTLTFTRNVSKVRTAILYFENVNFWADHPEYNAMHLHYRHMLSLDTLTYLGTVTGVNEKGDTYTKTITSILTITAYKGSLIVVSGTMTYVVGTASFTITFKQDPSHPHFTLVTVTNNVTGTSKSFDRRFGRIFRRYW